MTAFPKIFSLISVCAITLSSGCAQLSADTQPSTTTATTATEQNTPEPIDRKSLSGEDLFQLLLAEIATNRREYGAAAALYGELSDQYNDVAILERAVALNQTIGNYDDLLRHAEKFASLRPQEPRAQAAIALAATAKGDLSRTQTALESWLAMDSDADISIVLSALDELSAEQLQDYTEMLSVVADSHSYSGSLYYTQSRLEAALNRTDRALVLVDQALEIDPNIPAGLFKYQLLEKQGDTEAAGALIKSLYSQYPDNRQLAIQLTRHLYQYEPENLELLQSLHTRFSTEPVIARSYALAAFQQENYDSSQAVFQHLLTQGYHDEAHYYLGRIDLINALPELASDHFESVDAPPYLVSALAEWVNMARPADEARILTKLTNSREQFPDEAETLWRLQASFFQVTEQPQMAWQSYDDALIRFPQSASLLYDQAMLAAQMKRYPTLENNLLAILESDPDNTNALNALGYTWADLDKNLERAEQMIDRALAAEPDNPAFQDSKGWLLYRNGQSEQALSWLEKAFLQLENDEVAAHLAEVLWTLGREKEARQYLNEVKRLNPDSPYIGYLNELFTR